MSLAVTVQQAFLACLPTAGDHLTLVHHLSPTHLLPMMGELCVLCLGSII